MHLIINKVMELHEVCTSNENRIEEWFTCETVMNDLLTVWRKTCFNKFFCDLFLTWCLECW